MKKTNKILSVLLAVLIMMSTVSVLTVSASTGTTALTSGDYKYTLLDDATAKIKKYIGDDSTVEIPSEIDGYTVTKLGLNAFGTNSVIKEVTIPDTVVTIGVNCFHGCSNLEKVNIGNGVTKIGKYAFEECLKLKSIEIPDNVKTLSDYSFANSGLKTISLGKGVEVIGSYCFDGSKLNNIKIGKNVNKIKSGAFFETNNLKKITVNKKNKYFSSKAGVLYNKSQSKLIAYPNAKNKTELSVKQGVKVIGKLAFSYNTKLKKVNFPKSLKTIKESAFLSSKLTEITIPKNVTKIEKSAFNGCKNVTKLNINANKKLKINSFAFGGLKIKSLTVPKVNGDRVFAECKKLKKITVSSNVTKLTKDEFYNCTKLKSVTIPKTVKKIGKRALGYIADDYGNPIKSDKFVIYGYKNTVAERYAKKNNLKFTAIK